MTEQPIPKGVSPETLRDVIAGWAAVGADEGPRYTSDVAEETGLTDAAGRQTRFLETLGVLEAEGQRHRLTDEGAELARALDADDEETARERARVRFTDWETTDDLRDLLRGNPTRREELVRHLAVLTDQDLDQQRVSSGLGTLLDLYEWAGVLARDDADRYRLPPEEADTATEVAALRHEMAGTRDALEASAAETRAELTKRIEAEHEETRSVVETTGDDLSAAVERSSLGVARIVSAAEAGVEEALSAEFEDAEEELIDAVGETVGEAIEEAAQSTTETEESAAEAAESDVAAEESATTAPETDDGGAAAHARPETTRPGEDAVALSLDLNLDADPEEVESLVAGLRSGLLDEVLEQRGEE